MGYTTSFDANTRWTYRDRARRAIRAVVVTSLAGLAMWMPMEVEASCIRVTSCQVYEESAVVVQGTVTELVDVDIELGGRMYPGGETLVTLDVEKAWKGATPGMPIQIYSPGKMSSVGFEFVRGQRYLVFAYAGPGGRLQTSNCSHTNLIEKAGEDLAFLDTLSSPAVGGRVYGRVTFDQRPGPTGSTPEPRGVSGQRVSLKSASGVKEAVTLDDGRYLFEGLTPGTYELDADLPKGWNRDGLPRSMTLATVRSCHEAHIWTAIDGRLSGHIVGTDGLPLERAQVDVAPLENLRHPTVPVRSSASVSVPVDAQGRFEFRRLPPGRYVVGVKLTRSTDKYTPYRFAAYPGTTQSDGTSAIVLDTAQHLDLGVLTVARVPSKRVVQGSVSWADGRPVTGTRIAVSEIRPDWPGPSVFFAQPVRVDPEGRFAVELFEGVTYRIVAEAAVARRPPALPAPEATGAAVAPRGGRGIVSFGLAPTVRSNAVDLTVTGELPNVTLVLDEARNPPDR